MVYIGEPSGFDSFSHDPLPKQQSDYEDQVTKQSKESRTKKPAAYFYD